MYMQKSHHNYRLGSFLKEDHSWSWFHDIRNLLQGAETETKYLNNQEAVNFFSSIGVHSTTPEQDKKGI